MFSVCVLDGISSGVHGGMGRTIGYSMAWRIVGMGQGMASHEIGRTCVWRRGSWDTTWTSLEMKERVAR